MCKIKEGWGYLFLLTVCEKRGLSELTFSIRHCLYPPIPHSKELLLLQLLYSVLSAFFLTLSIILHNLVIRMESGELDKHLDMRQSLMGSEMISFGEALLKGSVRIRSVVRF